jgi:deoxyribose-phosphate aldolase
MGLGMTVAVPQSMTLTSGALARMIDVSAVQAFHTESDIRSLAGIASEHGFVAAHALPHFMPLLRSLLPVTGPTMAGGPVGFPSGGHATAIKVAEARQLVVDGAQELDMMLNVGRLKSGDEGYVGDEVRSVLEAIAPVPLKVILEISLLTDDEIRRGAAIVARSGAAFVKTGTGWTAGGTTLEKVRLISEEVGGTVGIKASGGIRSLETIAAMIELGVTRFGINTQVAVDLVRRCASAPGGAIPLRTAGA